MRSVSLVVLLAACASAPVAGLRVEPVPLDPPPRKVAWREDADKALEEAFTKRRPVLVYFVIPGDPACVRMDKETMSEPRVRGLWKNIAAIRVNVDETRHRDMVATYAPAGGFPGFTLFGPENTVAAQWTGFERSEAFRSRVEQSLRTGAVPAQWKEEWTVAMRRAREDDMDPLRELTAKLDREGARGWAARLAAAECQDRFYRYRWAGVVESADLFLKRFPDHPQRQAIEDLRARALYRGTGERAAGVLEEVAGHLDALGESAPVFGGAAAKREWAQRRRTAEDRLVAIGEPGAESLFLAVLDRQASVGEPAARALGRIRYSRLLPDVIDALADKSSRYSVRARVVSVMRWWAEPAFLAPLVAVVGDTNEPAIVRVAAAAAIARLGSSHGGLFGAKVINPVLTGLDSRSVDLRRETIRALKTVREEFELERLYPILEDRRASGVPNRRICDFAAELFLSRAGGRLVGPEGESIDGCPPGGETVIRDWWDSIQFEMRWEEARRRYVSRR